MTDRLVSVDLTTGELRALRCWLDNGGVVGEKQEQQLVSARRKLREADREANRETSWLLHWPRRISDVDGVGS